MKNLSLLFLTLVTSLSIAQTKKQIQAKDIQQLDTIYQHCLNKGENMYGCTVTYYNLLDSCLNVAYKQLHNKLGKTQQLSLKQEELDWLKTRDQKFKAIDKNNSYPGQDGEMMKQNQKDAIVKERVLQLIKKLAN